MAQTAAIKARKHHVFLFRHCVRSTSEQEKLHNNWTAVSNDVEKAFNVSNFADASMPYWNTPEFWCTKSGIDIIQGTGSFLFDMLAESLDTDDDPGQSKKSTARKRVKLQVLADISQRDVDTAFALFRGLQERSLNQTVNPNGRIELYGMQDLAYYGTLFSPWDQEYGICPVPLTTEGLFTSVLRQEIQKRLDTVSPPKPGLEETKKLLYTLLGTGTLGSIMDIPTWMAGSGEHFLGAPPINTTSDFPVLITDDRIFLAGPINIIKWYAQIAFYSRAGGIDEPFMPKASPSEVYQLLEWLHWLRTITDVENTIAATQGAVMARGILDALRDGRMHIPGSNSGLEPEDCNQSGENDDEDSLYDAKITIVVGHDTDLNSVGTALGFRWRLGWPYHTSPGSEQGEYVPTPPGSAMHLELDTETGTVEMSYLYPVYLQHNADNTVASSIPNVSGILESVPLRFTPRASIQSSIDFSLIGLSNDKKRTVLRNSGLSILEAQLSATLDTYPHSSECYNAFLNQTKFSLEALSAEWEASCGGTVSYGIIALIASGIVFLAMFMRCCYRRPHSEREAYDEVGVAEGLELT